MRDTGRMEDEVEFEEGEEPSFSDPEEFEDDISDQGEKAAQLESWICGLRLNLLKCN